MSKVFIYPTPESIDANNGIGRVVHAQYKYLPEFGIELVEHERNADVVALHTQQYTAERVDVLFNHGIYWTGDPGSGQYNKWHETANQRIADAARRAKRLVVPSDWVADVFRRDMWLEPRVIPHGIEVEQWSPLTDSIRAETPKYLLWGKNRAGDVCDPKWVHQLAERGIPAVTTFAPSGPTIPANLKIVGKQADADMRKLIRHSTALLMTTKETFGIQILEALASGVPVLGFDFGGQRDIIRHKVEGYLAKPYDLNDLEAGWHYILDHWQDLSEAARERSKNYTWERAMQMYADLLNEDYSEPKSAVSVIITCHNYGQYVAGAIESVLNQVRPADEIIVVNDGSTDNSSKVIQTYEDRVIVVDQANEGVASARNRGIQFASSPLIVCLDADDMLHPAYLQTLVPAFERDRGLGIAYTGLGLLSNDGTVTPNPWPPDFSWEAMSALTNPPASCIHSAAMFRKELWKRAGGYVQETAPAEDTYLWLTGLSRGFTAKRVTEEYLFLYRNHAGSASKTKKYSPFSWISWLKTKQYPFAVPTTAAVPVRSYSEPMISVIMPVSAAHLDRACHAIHSVYWQSFTDWELIVVGDGIDGSALKERFPFIKYIRLDEVSGPGAARNAGITSAKAPFVLFLDADDWLEPEALKHMLKAYKGRYIYTDWTLFDGNKTERRQSGDYFPETAIHTMLHPVTVLMTTEQAKQLLFDEKLPALEDFDFFARAASAGYHGERLIESLVVVNVNAGNLTSKLEPEFRKNLIDTIRAKYKGGEMAGCCGGNQDALATLARFNEVTAVYAPQTPVGAGKVRMEFTGEERGGVTYGAVGITRLQYRGGNNAFEKYVDADPNDVEWLERTGKWKRVSLSGV